MREYKIRSPSTVCVLHNFTICLSLYILYILLPLYILVSTQLKQSLLTQSNMAPAAGLEFLIQKSLSKLLSQFQDMGIFEQCALMKMEGSPGLNS